VCISTDTAVANHELNGKTRPDGGLGARLGAGGAIGYLSCMKSAYELAMERLNKVSPSKTLSAVQKEQIAELESLYKSRIAQAELAADEESAAAERNGDQEAADRVRARLKVERAKLQAELEERKSTIRER
jgi:hypothetical protein